VPFPTVLVIAAAAGAALATTAPAEVSSRILFVGGAASDVDAARLGAAPTCAGADVVGRGGSARAAAAVLLPSAVSPAGGMTLRGRPRRSASMLYACAAASFLAWLPRYFPLQYVCHFLLILFQATPLK
jgi:hypothetical protein